MSVGSAGPTTHTSQPVVTGSSVLGIKCCDGVVMASDTLGSYGSMARYRDLRRMVKVTDELVMGAGGEYSDFQAIIEMLEEITCAPRNPRPRHSCENSGSERLIRLPPALCAHRMEDEVTDDGCKMSPAACHEFLSRVMYNRRTKGDPLWNSLVLGGMRNGERCALACRPPLLCFAGTRAEVSQLTPLTRSHMCVMLQFSGRGRHAGQQLHRQHSRDWVRPAFGAADPAQGVEGLDDSRGGQGVAGGVHEGAVLS